MAENGALAAWDRIVRAGTLIGIIVGGITLVKLTISLGEFKAQVEANTLAHQANFRRIESLTDSITKLGIAVAALTSADEANRAHLMLQITEIKARLQQLENRRP